MEKVKCKRNRTKKNILQSVKPQQFLDAVKASISERELLMRLGIQPIAYHYRLMREVITKLTALGKIDTSHFKGQGYRRGTKGLNQKKPFAPPSSNTLRKYGLTLDEWYTMWKSQGEKCAICKLPPNGNNIVIDHLHVDNWSDLLPDLRKAYVRGLCCIRCNFLLPEQVDVSFLQSMLSYMQTFQDKLSKNI